MNETNLTKPPATGLTYGWWEKRRRAELPKTISDPRNYVLTEDELREYYNILNDYAAAVDKEKNAVRDNLLALQKGVVPSWGATPRCTTMCYVLEFVVRRGKTTLDTMNFLCNCGKRRVDEKNKTIEGVEAELRG